MLYFSPSMTFCLKNHARPKHTQDETPESKAQRNFTPPRTADPERKPTQPWKTVLRVGKVQELGNTTLFLTRD